MKRINFKSWLRTFTKKAVTAVLVISLFDLQLSYVLAFMGKEQIAETLSSTVAETIIGVLLGYLCKSVLETFLEKREDRLRSHNSDEHYGEDIP